MRLFAELIVYLTMKRFVLSLLLMLPLAVVAQDDAAALLDRIIADIKAGAALQQDYSYTVYDEDDDIALRYIAPQCREEERAMDAHIKKVYVPMTETGFYILLCLQKPNHGYGIVQTVEKKTEGEIRLSPGTMYGSLSKMEKDGLIRFVNEEDKRKIYEITALGKEILETEKKRIERLYRTSREEI